MIYTFKDFIEPIPKESPTLSPYYREWQETGVVHLPEFLPSSLIESYCAVREKVPSTNGWNTPIPYMRIPQLKDIALYPPLMQTLEALIGGPMGLHLNLTGWVSTERNWHQDGYLNPEHVGSHYAAVWMALDDIHPDSGPFEYVPGSHQWGMMTRAKIWEKLTPTERTSPAWPKIAEKILNAPCNEEIQNRGATVTQFIPKKGDVLIWHPRLLHRGSEPKSPGMVRKALINHYSALSHRHDMPLRAEHSQGCYYFVLQTNDPIEDNYKNELA